MAFTLLATHPLKNMLTPTSVPIAQTDPIGQALPINRGQHQRHAVTCFLHDAEAGEQALHGVFDAVQGASISYAQRSADFVSSHA